MTIRAKNVMYVQKIDYLPESNLVDVIKRIEAVLNPVKYAGIIHDKDLNENGEPISAHVHIVMQFENARSLNNLAKLLNEKPQNIEKWNGNVNNAYSYLLHHTNGAQLEYQYDVKEVIANFDYSELITSIQKNVNKHIKVSDSSIINNILDLIYDGHISKEKAENMLTGSQYAKAAKRINSVHQKRNEVVAAEWRKEMLIKQEPVTIIWLYGEAGSGKTRIAKKYAKNFTDKYYISGSSRDPFQKYQGENVVILDELRPQVFDYSDLLKMLDPYNDLAMASSRYFDKPLTANVFIITTPYSPRKFYNEIKNSGKINSAIDRFEQLARRITLVQKMTMQEMFLLQYSEKENDFLIEEITVKDNPYTVEESDKTATRDEAIQIYQKLTTTLGSLDKE